MQRTRLSFCFVLLYLSCAATTLQAAPITGGTGPGGIGTTNGASSLEWWLTADTITGLSGGQPVVTWNDQSGNGRNVNGNGQTWQTGVQNNLPSVLFQLGQAPFNSLTSMTVGTVYVMARYNTPTFASYDGLFNAQNVGGEFDLYFTGNSGTGNWYPNTQLNSRYVNGSLKGATIPTLNQFNSYSGTDSTPQTYSDWVIGRDRNIGAREWRGYVSEVVVHDRVLNQAEKIILDNYMSAKYSVALDTSGSNTQNRYSGDDNAQGDYDFGVFGVLNVSGVSVTNSGMDGFGIEATPGASQGALAGYKVLNNTIMTGVNIGPQLYADIWARSWYVDSNETFGATIGFNSVDAGLGALDGSQDYFILFRDTEVGDWSVLGQGTINGNSVTLNLDNLLSGYYTLAFNVNYLPEPSSFMILGLGAVCLASRKQRRRR